MNASSHTRKPALVFIDIDGTLVSPSTVWHFFLFCIKNRIAPKTSFIYAGQQLIMNNFNRFNVHKALELWLELLVGTHIDHFTDYCRQTFDQRIHSCFIPSMLMRIDRHKAQGDHVILLSSTIQCFAQIIAELLQLDGYYSLEVQVENEKLTNKVVSPIPYHQGKVHYAQQHAQKTQLTLTDAFFYTDNISDLPLLQQIGHPIAVNPDRHLYRIAKQQGWLLLRDKQRINIYEYLAEKN